MWFHFSLFWIFLTPSSLKRSSLRAMSPAPAPLPTTPCPWRGTHPWAATPPSPSHPRGASPSPRTGTAWVAAAPTWCPQREGRRKRSWTASQTCPLLPPSCAAPCGRCLPSEGTAGGQGKMPPMRQKSTRGGEWRAALVYSAPTHAYLSKL